MRKAILKKAVFIIGCVVRSIVWVFFLLQIYRFRGCDQCSFLVL
uniref:Uncharacterized protein n=1 Tax=Anopheles atroparvus TaxID=41427 RepID=A0AAG5D9J9_ANOAO